jgi:hypothetical protein
LNSPQQIIDEGFDAGLVEKSLSVRNSEFKRRQSANGRAFEGFRKREKNSDHFKISLIDRLQVGYIE